MGFFLGIDLGTSYFKAGLFDEHNRLIGLGRSELEKKIEGLRCELSIDQFWRTLNECVGQAMQQGGVLPEDICACSYSSQANSFVLLDEKGEPLTPIILWSDERVGHLPEPLLKLTAHADFLKKTGQGILSGNQSMIAKILWIQENDPSCWSNTSKILSISDYLTYSLTGKYESDFSTASMTGLFSVSEGKWWKEALHLVGIVDGMLSHPARTGNLVGPVTDRGSEWLGLLPGTLFFSGGLDHHIAAVGAGLPGTDHVSESTGTVLACVNYRNGYRPRIGINVAPGLGKNGFFQMAFDSNGGNGIVWYCKHFAPEYSIDELLEMAGEVSPGCDGLVASPSSEGYSGLECFLNIQGRHGHGHFARAIMESTGRSLRSLVDQLDPDHLSDEVISCGGGARSPLWTQIKSEILQKKFSLPSCTELACLGAAMIAAEGVSDII